MPIHYSLGRKTAEPGKKNPEKKVYASVQNLRVCPTEEFVNKVIKRGFVGDRGHIIAVVSAVVDCLREELLQGSRVYVGDLGSFYCEINGTGADTPEEFSVQDNIRGLTVKWVPSKYFQDLHQEAEYKRVLKRSTQILERRESNREMNESLEASQQKSEEDE